MVLKRAGIIVLNFEFSFVVFQWFCDFIFGKILDFILFYG
jgi:preprotein translocase subunit SecE